jgi:hypothetical protein
MKTGPFSSKAVKWIAISCSVSLVVGLVLMMSAPTPGGDKAWRAGTYSRSAIGHSAFFQILKRLDIPVLASGNKTGQRADADSIVVIMAPSAKLVQEHPEEFEKILDTRARALIVVLPKWMSVKDPTKKGWIKKAAALPTADVNRVLKALKLQGKVKRISAKPNAWTWHRPWTDAVPALAHAQIIASSSLTPILSSSQGQFVGLSKTENGTPLVVVSDPDIFSTWALENGRNAELAVNVVNRFRPKGGTVVFDEVFHGFKVERSFWRELFEVPVIFITISVLLLVFAFLLYGLRRFGSPQEAQSPFSSDKAFLINNTADLLRFGRHSGTVLESYFKNVVQNVAKALNAPSKLDAAQRIIWLQNVSRIRKTNDSIEILYSEVFGAKNEQRQQQRNLKLALRIYQWRKEMIR